MEGALGLLAITYRALHGTPYTAPVIRDLEHWELAAVLGEDIGPPPPAYVAPVPETVPGEPAPSSVLVSVD